MPTAIDRPAGAGGPVQPCPNDPPPRPCQGLGMSAPAEIESFADDMANLQREWPLLLPADRIARLQAIVDARANAAGFLPPAIKAPSGLGNRSGELRFMYWQVAINPALLESNSLSPKQAAALGNTLYHETRHAEQWSLMAKRQAAEGRTAEQIRDELLLPGRIASDASRHPLLASDPRRPCADALHKSVYGEDGAARNQTLRNVEKHGKDFHLADDAHEEAMAEEERLKSQLSLEQKAYLSCKERDPPPTRGELDAMARQCNHTIAKLKAAQLRTEECRSAAEATYSTYSKTYNDYRTLPEEADAWDSGGRAATAIISRFSTGV